MLTPQRRRGVEILDLPDVDPEVVTRSLADVARCNALFGGLSSALDEIRSTFKDLPRHATLLDVGTGLGDIPCRARALAREHGLELTTIGLDSAAELVRASRQSVSGTISCHEPGAWKPHTSSPASPVPNEYSSLLR